mgnify:CR=1 FL=1
MSIQSQEISELYSLYQNLNEEKSESQLRYEKRKAEFEKRKERIKNPFGNTTIQTKDGKELKQGDEGFDDALKKARETVRKANNKSLDKSDSSTSDKKETIIKPSSSSSTTKKIPGEFPGTKKEFDAKYGSDDSKDNKVIQPKPKAQKDEVKSKSTGDVGFDGKPVTPGNRGASIPVSRDGKVKPGIQKDDKGGFEKKPVTEPEIKLKDPGVITPKVETPKPVEKKPVPTQAAKPKVTARSLMRQRNIERFGADRVNNLINKQKDFKTMQKGGTQTPFAASQGKLKPGVAKSQFAAKYPKSNVAKDLNKSKRIPSVMDMESYDAYDLVLSYLMETEQVASIEEANYIMTEMDEKTIQTIVEMDRMGGPAALGAIAGVAAFGAKKVIDGVKGVKDKLNKAREKKQKAIDSMN